MVVAAASLLLSAVLFRLNYTQAQDIKGALNEIQQSRIVLSRQSCRQRNNERAVQRSNLKDNLQNLARISDANLQQLGFTRKQAVAQIVKQLRQVAPLDCKKLIRQVAGNKIGSSIRQGGGSESNGAPRPQASTGRSEVKTGPNGGSGAPKPRSPSEGRGGGAKPPSGNPPAAGSPKSPSGPGNGGVVNPSPPAPVTPHPDPGGLVQSLVDGVGQVVQKLLP